MDEKKVKSRISQKNIYVNSEKKNSKIKSRIDSYGRSISGMAYYGGKLATGALGVVEGAIDLVTGGLSDLFGNDEYADYVFQYDNWVQDLNQKLDEAYNPGKVGRFVGDVASGLGQSATFLIPGAGQVLFFAGVTGNAVSSASQTTGKTGFREYVYGAMSGTLEALLERYIAGTGQTLESITKSGAKNIASKVVKSYGKAAAKTTTQKMVAAQLISSAVGEGLEEFAGNIGDVGLRRLTGVDKEASINWSDAFYETLVGMTSGALMGGVSTSVQTAYEAKNGAQINSDAKRRDTMLTQARGLVKMAKEQSLDKGSDSVAARLSEIEASLTAYDNAKDKSGGAANIALGKINQALMGAELNIITDRHAEYIASLSDTELEQLAEYANAYFKDAGVEVTAKDLKDINNQITRALATLDWAGKVVNTMIGTDRILNEEVLAKMEAQQVSEEERAAYQNEQNAKAELERVKTEASENAKPITEGATWNGEAASYHGYLNGAETTLHIEKRNDGAYQAFFITEDGVRPVKLTEEQVKAALAKMTDTENRAEENKSSKGEVEVTKEEKQPETKENEGKTAKEAASDGKETEEENAKASLGADSIPENETAKAKKPSEEYTETAFKATPEEVKAATKAVKQFKLLDAETREAIIQMMRSAGGIDKVTVQSIAVFMSVRSGLHVRFMKDHRAEGSYDVLTKSGRRLILLDPSKMNGKHWRADIFFHELFHDMVRKGNMKGLTKAIYDTAAPSFQHAVADLYTAYYNKGVSISKFLDGKKWTEKNVEAYFDAHNGVSFDAVMEEVAAGTMGRVMGSKKFIRSLRQVGILKRVYYNIAELVQSIANRSITVGGDNTAGFTLTFRDALGYKAMYSRAVIESEANLSPEAIAELRRVIEEAAERDEELGTGKKALPIDEQMVARSYATDPTRFSLEFAPRIAERQLALEQNKVPTDILAKAIKDTDAMVKAMLPYSNILPPDKIGKTVVSNGSYDRSIENTTICVRTLAYNEFIDLVQEKLGRPLTAMESFLVSQKLYDIAKEPQCLYCYVSLDRKAYNEMMLRYLNDRDDVIEEWKKSDKSDQTREDMYQRFLRGRKPTANMRENFDLFLSLAESGEAITASDVATEQRRAEIANYGTASQKDQLNKILKYAQSASWAKKQQNYVAYNDEIIKFSPRIVANLNKHYGLRWYSFSDYSGAFIVENMQQITDAALKGLKGLAYTKDTDFVEIFAPSGININISVFVTKGKDGFVIDEAQSADLQKAIELRKKYPNVGIVAVATNDEGVRWALDQEWSDVVIPFHTVRTGADVANFYEWDVYNEQQSDKVENETLWDAYVASTGKKKVSKNIYPSEHHNDRETYLALTEARGLKPRFSEFLDNVNYMKLVNETRQSADETKPLQPIFNLDAAQESFRKFVDKGGYYDGWYFDDVDLEAESAEVASDIAAGKTAKDVEYGRQDVDYETMYARRKQSRQHSGTKNANTRYSLSLDSTPEVTVEAVQAEVDHVKWGFEWTDAKLLDNLNAVRRYLSKKYPDNAISIEIDNDQKRVIVDGISRFVDFDAMPYDVEFADFLRSIGVEEADIASHLTAFTPIQRQKAVKKVREGEEKAKKAKAQRPRAYYKNQVTTVTNAILAHVIAPMAGGEAKLLGKDKTKLVNWLWRKMNTAKNQAKRRKIANIVAEAFIARTIYADYEVNQNYEEMVVSGVIEDYDNVRGYLRNIRAESVASDVIARYGEKKGRAVLNRWTVKEGGISVGDAIAELQDQGLMTDVSKKNEADLLIALNEEYERLKGLAELRREFVPLALADKATLDDIQRTVREMIMDFFEVGGKETEYARLARRYQELLAEKDAKQQKEIEALEARLNEAFTKRIDRAQAEADRRMAKAKERFDRRLTEANYGREYAKRMNRISADVRSLRDYVNRDYTAADSMEDRQTRGIAKAFLKATTRTGVKPQAAREAARVLLSWAETAMKDNENFIGTDPLHSAMTQEELDAIRLLAASGQRQGLTDKELEEFGISREKYEAAMEAQKAKESLSLEELEEFHTALKVAIRNYRNYDRFWNGERWVDLNEKARDAVSVVQTANENFGKKGFLHRLSRGIRKIAMPFLDPLSVAAAIDGYNYSGVFQELLTKLAYAEAEKNKIIIELRKPFEEFLKEHPKYQKRLSETIIELEDGFKITVGQALTLTELNKRDQAKTALAISRIAFRMDDGSVKKLDGFDKLPKITTPNGQTMSLIEAKELVRGLQITPDTAINTLKSKGYTERTLAEFEKAVQKAEAEAMPLIAQFGEQRQQMIAKIEKQLTDDDRSFIKVVSDFFQTTSKEAKTKADIRNLGYTNVIDGYYFPIKRRAADIAKNISDGTPFTDFITTVNLSFNQSIVPNAKASIDVANVWDVVTEHINGLAMWEHLYLPIQNINKIYNKNVNAGTGNVLSVKSLLDERTEAKYGAWLKDLLLDVQGARQRETKTIFDQGINAIRGTYAVYQLGFNPQTVVKQTLSWAAAAQYLSPASIAKGITTPRLNAKELDRVSAVAAERMGEATVVKALSNTEKISKIGEKTMWGISKMDRLVNEGLFAMCQHEVAAKDPKKPIGSEENLVEAGKLVSEVILKVQDSSDISTKSQAARSSNEIIKAFTMFQSAGLKMFSRIFENVGFVMNYKHMSAEDQAKYGGQYKKAQKQLARSVGSAAAVAVLTAIIVQMFKFLYDKDREDKDGNEITVAEDLATDAATELVGFVPVVGDVVDYFVNGYEMSNFFEDTANDTLKAFSQTFALMGKVASGEVIEDWEVGSMLRKVSRAAGSLTGIPVRNVENVLSGLTRRFFPEAGYTYDTLFYRANYSEDINKALKEGDTELAGHILELMIKRGKTGGKSYSDETIEALVELHNAGYDVFPKSPDYEKLDRKGLEQFETVYQEADAAVEKLVKSEAFKAMAQYGTDESSPQASAIKTLYSGFFDLAEHDVLNEELSRSAAYFTVTDEHDLVLVKAYDKAIKLKTVEMKGSRKAMLKAYMKELGMDKTAQAYAAYSCGYRTDDITSVIYSDLKEREDEKELLIALGLIDADEDKKEDEAA